MSKLADLFPGNNKIQEEIITNYNKGNTVNPGGGGGLVDPISIYLTGDTSGSVNEVDLSEDIVIDTRLKELLGLHVCLTSYSTQFYKI